MRRFLLRRLSIWATSFLALGHICAAQNILNNSGFEYGLMCYLTNVWSTTDIFGSGDYKIQLSPDAYSGSQSLEISCSAGDCFKAAAFSNYIPAAPNESYTLSLYAKCLPGATAAVYIPFTAGGDTFVLMNCTGSWALNTINFKTSPTAQDFYFYLFSYYGGWVRFDDVVLTYADGTVPNPISLYPGTRTVSVSNRTMSVDGNPYLALGFFDVGYNDLPQAAATGANTVIGLGLESAAAACFNTKEKGFLDRAYELGLNFVPDSATTARLGVPTAMANAAQRFAPHRANIAWMLADEPDQTLVPFWYIQPNTYLAAYAEAKSQTSLPVFADFQRASWSVTTDVAPYQSGSDLLMAEPYGTDLNNITHAANMFKSFSPPRPMWMAQEDTDVNLIVPKAYWAVINGSTGIAFFRWPAFKTNPPKMAAAQQTISELNSLKSAIFGQNIDAEVTAGPQVGFMARSANGSTYILAVNPVPQNVQATFQMSGLLAGEKIQVLFENRTITATAGQFTDSFAGVERHVYTIDRSAPAPVAITNLTVTQITETSAVVQWATNQPASDQVLYGTSAAYGLSTPLVPSNSTSHSVTLSGLSPDTSYLLKAISANGSESSSATATFRTLNAPLQISEFSVHAITDTTALVSWRTSREASVNLLYGTTLQYGSRVTVPTLSTSSNTQLTGLAAGRTHYIKLIATDANAVTSEATATFTTTVEAAAAPTGGGTVGAPMLVSPANGTFEVSAAPVLTWNAAANATAYEVYFGSSLSPSLVATVSSTSYPLSGLSADTVYYWRIVAKNASSSESSAIAYFKTASTRVDSGAPSGVPGIVGAPTLVSPANGTFEVSAAPVLTWNAAANATAYELYFGSSLSPGLVATVSSTSYPLTALSADTVYYWRIVAKNASSSESSAIAYFKTASTRVDSGAPSGVPGIVGAPTLVSPANGTFEVSAAPVLTWNAAANATAYELYFGSSLSPGLVATVSSTSYPLTALSADTVYYWRIVAKNASSSESSAIAYFKTASTRVDSGAPSGVPGIVGAPTLVSPANGTFEVSAAPVLTWNAAANATAYEVYFGSSLSPSLVATVSSTSYPLSGLSADTVYYWRIVAKNASSSESSAIAYFKTASSPD